jgi:molecular chaperone DnaK (HSP70)
MSDRPIDSRQKHIVVGLDFGTSRSSFSWALTNTATKHVAYVKNWDDKPNVPTLKTLTSLLYKGSSVESWGFTAQKNLSQKLNQSTEYSYVSKFKMDLYRYRGEENQEKREKVYSHIVNYLSLLHDKVMTDINNTLRSSVTEDDIKWVFTIPSIWNDEEKYIMKKAAEESGFITSADDVNDESFVLVLEPEAAAVFCILQTNTKLEDKESLLIIDAGGGTVDLTVHTFVGGVLEEKTVRGGGPYGSIILDENFLEIMSELLTPEVMEEFISSSPAAFHDLMVEWEVKKCSQVKNLNDSVYIALPAKLTRIINKKGISVDGFNEEDGELKLSNAHIKKIYQANIDNILTLIDNQLKSCHRSIDYCFIVGGFGESPVLQQEIKKKFRSYFKKGIIVPEGSSVGPSGAVVGGATLIGLDNSLIRVRRLNLTYGVEVQVALENAGENEFLDEYLSKMGNGYSYINIMSSFAKKNDPKRIDEVTSKVFDVPNGKDSVDIVIYSSPQRDIRYTVDKTEDKRLKIIAQPIGTLKVNVPVSNQKNRQVRVYMGFGKVDIKVQAECVDTGEKCECVLQFSKV